MASKKKYKSAPGRIVMLEPVPAYRGCMRLAKGSVQRLDEEATKELLKSGRAEVYEDYVKRTADEGKKKAAEAKKTAEAKPVAKTYPKGPKAPAAPKPKAQPKGPKAPKAESK